MEPLGQSQVLAYIEKLSSSSDFNFTVISFEKVDDLKNTNLLQLTEKRCKDASINWIKLKYHKKPTIFATLFDILNGIFRILFLVKNIKVDVIHARSYVPALIALFIKKIFGTKYIFDMRGFWADERVDGGLWKKDGYMFTITKKLEKRFLLSADHVVSLTRAGIDEMKKFNYLKNYFPNYSIIPTCTDLNKFRPLYEKKDNPFTLGYLGTAGTWYQFEDVIRAFKILLSISPDSNFLIINKNEHDYINQELHKADIPEKNVQLISSGYEEVPYFINQMDAAIFFIKPVFSKQSSSPTKLAEILGCGIPCLSNEGVGDMSSILTKNKTGITIKDFSSRSLEKGIKQLMSLTREPDIVSRCLLTAKEHFSLENGVRDYKAIYSVLRG